MKCLNLCQAATLQFFMGFSEKAIPLYRAAEELADEHTAADVCNACDTLERLGLLKNVGTNTKQLVLSSPCMGDIAAGYFNKGQNTSLQMLELQEQILQLQLDRDAAADKAAASGAGSGGVVSAEELARIKAAKAADKK